MTSSEKTPLLQSAENVLGSHHEVNNTPHAVQKNASHSTLSRSFSNESGQFGGAVISYHDICYSITTKQKGVKTERKIIKNLRWDC